MRPVDSSDGNGHTATLTNRLTVSVYSRLAPFYDVLFGAILQPGRRSAVARMQGRRVRVLVVGVGTGLNVPLYQPDYRVTGIDLSGAMLQKAQQRSLHDRRLVTLVQMDAMRLGFDDNVFDIVYAAYAIS